MSRPPRDDWLSRDRDRDLPAADTYRPYIESDRRGQEPPREPRNYYARRPDQDRAPSRASATSQASHRTPDRDPDRRAEQGLSRAPKAATTRASSADASGSLLGQAGGNVFSEMLIRLVKITNENGYQASKRKDQEQQQEKLDAELKAAAYRPDHAVAIDYIKTSKARCQKEIAYHDRKLADNEAEIRKLAEDWAKYGPFGGPNHRSNAGAAKPAHDSQLSDRLASLEDRMTQYQKRQTEASFNRQQSQDKRLRKLEEQLGTRKQASSSEATELKQKVETLQASNSSKDAEIASLNGKVDELQQQLQKMRDSFAALQVQTDQAFDDMRGVVRGHARQLGLIDFERLDNTIERASMEFPSFRITLDKQESEIGVLHTAVQNTQKITQGFEKAQDDVLRAVSGMIDECSARVEAVATRVGDLERRLATQASAGPAASSIQPTTQTAEVSSWMRAANDRFSLMQNQMQVMMQNQAALWQQPLTVLQKQVAALQQQMACLDDLRRNDQALDEMVKTLDDQFKNLSTTALAEQIVGHLNRVYPTPLRFQDDIRDIQVQMDKLKESKHKCETFMGEFSKIREGIANDKALQDVLQLRGQSPEKLQQPDAPRQTMMPLDAGSSAHAGSAQAV